MSDTDAFESQVAREVVLAMGPLRPVDDAAMFTAITSTGSPKWRLGSMFSATRIVATGALVALFAGLLFTVQTIDPTDNGLPGAATDSEATGPVEFTATTYWNEPGGVTEDRWRFPFIETTDPRVDGTMTTWFASETYGHVEVTVQAGARIENDGGAWQEVPDHSGLSFSQRVDEGPGNVAEDGVMEVGHGDGERSLRLFIGEGGYEGFFIVAEETYSATRLASDLRGYIIEGDPPVVAERSSAE